MTQQGQQAPQHAEEPRPYRVRRIHHVGITVADLDRSLVFYRDLLGMNVIGCSDEEDVGAIVGIPGARAHIADLDAGNGQILELLEYGRRVEERRVSRPDTIGSCHLSLQVAQLDAALSRLEDAGFTLLGQVAQLSTGGVWHDCTVVYLRDPDGIILELIERATDD